MPSLPSSPTATLRGRFTQVHATRLLWRAGFGPRPGDAERLAKLGLDGAVAALTRPRGPARLEGPPPDVDHGGPLDPIDVWGANHCWWLDRMVRSNHQLIERMTLVWHSWFATSSQTSSAALMLAQNQMMRARALGNFHDLLLQVTCDPAMLMWLSGTANNRDSPNENYGRELMELFTLGADRGYSERDVHEQARALTGFTCDWGETGPRNFRFAPALHDPGVKRIFGRRGRFDWRDSCRLCVTHPLHPAFVVAKLWDYFIAQPVPDAARRALERCYVASGFEIRPLMEAILRHPLLYEGPRMVIAPVVYCAGLLRATRQTVKTIDWAWVGEVSGQLLFSPPNVAGWDYTRWLDTSRWAGRLMAVNTVLAPDTLSPDRKDYPADESPEQAVAGALAHWGNPRVSPGTLDDLVAFSRRAQAEITQPWSAVPLRIERQNALRALVALTPDCQTC